MTKAYKTNRILGQTNASENTGGHMMLGVFNTSDKYSGQLRDKLSIRHVLSVITLHLVIILSFNFCYE